VKAQAFWLEVQRAVRELLTDAAPPGTTEHWQENRSAMGAMVLSGAVVRGCPLVACARFAAVPAQSATKPRTRTRSGAAIDC
jgi:hypothetical protein